MKTDTFRTLGDTSADAAGLSILAGLVRPDEGLPSLRRAGQGAINHALRVHFAERRRQPAIHLPGLAHRQRPRREPTIYHSAARLRLENTPAINALINAMPPESQIVARAMQQYGLILADIGSAMYRHRRPPPPIDTVDRQTST